MHKQPVIWRGLQPCMWGFTHTYIIGTPLQMNLHAALYDMTSYNVTVRPEVTIAWSWHRWPAVTTSMTFCHREYNHTPPFHRFWFIMGRVYIYVRVRTRCASALALRERSLNNPGRIFLKKNSRPQILVKKCCGSYLKGKNVRLNSSNTLSEHKIISLYIFCPKRSWPKWCVKKIFLPGEIPCSTPLII